MALTVRRHNYFIEVTPATKQDPIAASPLVCEVESLPPPPGGHMPDAAQPSPPRLPIVFIISAIVWTLAFVGLAHGWVR